MADSSSRKPSSATAITTTTDAPPSKTSDWNGPPWGTGKPPWGDGPPPWITAGGGGRPGACPGEDGNSVSVPVEYRSYIAPWCDARWVSDASVTPTGAPSSRGTTLSTITTSFSKTSTTPVSSLPPAPDSSSTSESQAWVAGPVVGSIGGLALIFGAGFMLWRRRRRQQTRFNEPAELGADKGVAEAADAEKERPETMYEMEGSSPIDLYVEKPANEAPARELVS